MRKYLRLIRGPVVHCSSRKRLLRMGNILAVLIPLCLQARDADHFKTISPENNIAVVVSTVNPIDPQNILVSGTVTGDKEEPLAGVSVTVRGSSLGTFTNDEGRYSLNVPEGSILIFSFTGYASQEISADGKTTVDVQLVENANLLNEVVVTALGIQRNQKSISYATQKVEGKELNVVPQTNFMNSLSGKVAGVTINSSASGIGGSVKVLMRGNKFVKGNNQPLYVVDGIPLVNNPNASTASTFGGRDDGDGISNLNPDDIESISVLKGASSAALYGSAAANGVILITTKKGRSGTSSINFSSSYTADKFAYIPELQNSYGQTSPGSEFSWGSPITNATDNISDFYKTGNTLANAISFSSGTEKAQTYVSYSNTAGNGIMRNNSLSRHNFSARETVRYFDNKLKIDVGINYIHQSLNNSPELGYTSPLMRLFIFPRGMDFNQYKNPVKYDSIRKINTQNWFLPPSSSAALNPYWMTDYIQFKDIKKRTILKFAAQYDLTNSLNLQVRGNMDQSNNVNTSKWYAGSPVVVAGTNGQYGVKNINYTQYYADAILNYKKSLGSVQLNAVIGSSITDSRSDGESISSFALYIPNVFTIQNMNLTSINTAASSASVRHSQLQAVFGNINLSYKDWLYLDVTGRNDWSSNLSFTPNGSYFYPSAGLSLILSEALKLPDLFSYVKLRGSYAVIGNTVPIYVTNPMNYIGRGGNIQFNTTAPFEDLNPEKSKSFEAGTELRFFNDELSIDFTYYKTNSINQFFSIMVPPGTGYSERFINAGNIQNSGVELMLGYTPSFAGPLRWRTQVNFSSNKNIIKSLAKDIDQFVLAEDANFYYSILKPGGSYGDIYGMTLQRDSASGKVIFGDNNVALVKTGAPSFLGNPNPKFQLGWSNSFDYKNFTLGFLVDGRFGGKVFSKTEMYLDLMGVSKVSGEAREKGGFTVDGMLADGSPVTTVDAYDWYYGNASNKVNGEYMYDATVVRLREASISYSFPRKMFKGGVVKNMQLSLIGRNLVYLYKPAPFDSEIAYSIGNGFAGVDVFNLPATHSFGLKLNITL